MPSKLALGSIALSLSHVASYRQKIAMLEKESSAIHMVDAISARLELKDFAGVQGLIQEMVGVTPGAGEAFKGAISKAVPDIRAEVIQKIKKGHEATQTQLDQDIAKLTGAGGAADQSKKGADVADQALFECYAAQQKKTKAAEDAREALGNAKAEQEEACQLQEDNKDFEYSTDATPSIECDFGVQGQCDEKLAAFDAELDNISQDASGKLSAEQEQYNALKATCEKKTAKTLAAEGVLAAAEAALASQRANCDKLHEARTGKVCSYGEAVQAKCASEGAFQTLVAATNRAKDEENVNSEVDRIQEWLAAYTTDCMLGRASEKWDGAIDPEDMKTCTEKATEARYAQAIGTLHRHEGAFKQLSGSNPCADGPISFYNGQEWSVVGGPVSLLSVAVESVPISAPVECGDGVKGTSWCSVDENAWHHTIERHPQWAHKYSTICKPTHVSTGGQSCSAHCESKGYVCIRAQDNKGGCNLDGNHHRKSMDNNGCDQTWGDQVCQCGKAKSGGKYPSSSDYTLVEFKPTLQLEGTPFPFCFAK